MAAPTDRTRASPAEDAPTLRAMAELERRRQAGEPILPVRITPHYRALVEAEVAALGRTGGPLHSVVYPRADRFKRVARGEHVNFADDFGHMPPGLERVLVHRYPGKVLYFPTDHCAGHCQFCLRPDVTGASPTLKHGQGNLDDDVLDRVVDYLRSQPRVREVIFSGGDPLVCPPGRLRHAVEHIMSVPTVRWCRFHSRAPIYDPKRLSDQVIELLAEWNIRFVLHVVHPYELCEAASDRLRLLRRAGVPAYNQFPLLRGINDHPAVLLELSYACAELGIQMLSLFTADPIRYGATYRVRLERAFDIVDRVFLRGESWAANFRMCIDTPHGKVRREHIVRHEPSEDRYVFQREGREITYYDIPTGFDQPTPLETLMWRGARFVELEK